jgi:electron-transferring-flavoprotein dehydrogenase
MVNVPTLKGVHYAMHAGMHAAEAIYERLKGGGDCADLSNYQKKIAGSEFEKDTYRSRNMRQPFAKGFLVGGAIANMMEISGGRVPGGHWPTHDDATVPVFIGPERDYPKPDGKKTFDKLSSVFASGNATRDDAPNHIRIQDKVPLEVALMWQNMCPAQVYEVPDDQLEAATKDGKLDGKHEVKLQVTPSNCVQCGAITAKGGRLTPPEGGDGPNYQLT